MSKLLANPLRVFPLMIFFSQLVNYHSPLACQVTKRGSNTGQHESGGVLANGVERLLQLSYNTCDDIHSGRIEPISPSETAEEREVPSIPWAWLLTSSVGLLLAYTLLWTKKVSTQLALGALRSVPKPLELSWCTN